MDARKLGQRLHPDLIDPSIFLKHVPAAYRVSTFPPSSLFYHLIVHSFTSFYGSSSLLSLPLLISILSPFSELFADSCGIAHLRQCFAELKELVRASLHPDLQQMADNANLRKSLFPRLDPLRLASLLEKVHYITIPSFLFTPLTSSLCLFDLLVLLTTIHLLLSAKTVYLHHHCLLSSAKPCTVLYCTVLYCTVLYCTVLYCTVLYSYVLLRSEHLDWLSVMPACYSNLLFWTHTGDSHPTFCREQYLQPPSNGEEVLARCREEVEGAKQGLNSAQCDHKVQHSTVYYSTMPMPAGGESQ